MNKALVVLMLLVVVALLAGCGAGAYAVSSAEVTDMITNTEARQNGTYMVWVRTDVTAVFCTTNESFYRLAQQYRDELRYVTMSYNSINAGDPDGAFLGSGCDPEAEGVQTYRILSIRPAGGDQ